MTPKILVPSILLQAEKSLADVRDNSWHLPEDTTKKQVKHPKLALLRARYERVITHLRKRYFKLLGLNAGEGTSIGKITCEWPGNVLIGKTCTIQNGVHFGIQHPFSGENYIKIGDRVFIGRCCTFNCTSKITIGNDTMIGSNTIILDVDHERGRESTINTQPIISKDVTIGNDVGIGAGCIVLPGVIIGSGSLIAAGSIIAKSIPEYEIWGGVPARFYCKRR